jgi:hypothetical protein
MSLTLIYPYRDREIERIKISLDSLTSQTNTNFKVFFVDYGSTISHSQEVQELLQEYSFVNYQYSYHLYQPWSRAKAVNIGLKLVETESVFVADIDMIFREDFIEKLYELRHPKKSIYFKVGFLSEEESRKSKLFEDYKIKHFTGIGAQGLSIFPTQAIKKIRGFDEFLHFWGAEDADIHNRLLNAGYEVDFFEKETLMLHRWHPTYRKLEEKNLSQNLQISNITTLNQEHLASNKRNNLIIVNDENWGKLISKLSYDELFNEKSHRVLVNKKEQIDHFLFVELTNFKNGILNVTIIEDEFENGLKHKLKKLWRKKVPCYYTLKEINDMFLLHIISFYHNYNYIYKVSADLKSIEFKIQKA